ncbi:hypothetical protein DFQ28_011167 [Apophysomyces sp. BC1034]|nr:hypothetical protein DFQ29_009473 [Apophysomyces sp. BC1021]KAG0173256.1 hypothetical protein DFQ30_008400 [Apophysomyces sp. BC1015]KAG0191692.1 hypothetical protein DFQ28_011167 [Apophysomyces sp. BC1034]
MTTLESYSAISAPGASSLGAVNGLTSSISTKATSMSEPGVPDFTDFSLDPFHLTSDSGTPAPHCLRETRRSLILSLEPCEGTPLQISLKQFQEQSYIRCGPNQAHNTAPHISVLGRVHIQRGPDFATKWKVVDDFVDVVEQEMERLSPKLSPPTFAGYEMTERPTRAVMMRLRVDPLYNKLARTIEQRMGSQCTALEVRHMDRMPLAYNILRTIPGPTLKKLREMAKQTIDIDDWVRRGGAWQLTLYEVMLESRVVGVRQQIKPLRSWPIRNNEKTSPFMLPVSLRIKLATLSSWFRLTPAVDVKLLEDAEPQDEKY